MNTLERMPERFNLLPEDFQQAIRTFDYDKRLQTISHKHKLHIDQLVALETTMSDVIFGTSKAADLQKILQQSLRISHDKALEITMELNNTILSPLKSHIMEVQHENYELAHPKPIEKDNGLREVL